MLLIWCCSSWRLLPDLRSSSPVDLPLASLASLQQNQLNPAPHLGWSRLIRFASMARWRKVRHTQEGQPHGTDAPLGAASQSHPALGKPARLGFRRMHSSERNACLWRRARASKLSARSGQQFGRMCRHRHHHHHHSARQGHASQHSRHAREAAASTARASSSATNNGTGNVKRSAERGKQQPRRPSWQSAPSIQR